MDNNGALLQNLDRLHTTALGLERIRRNLSLDTEDAVEWCRGKIRSPEAQIERRGKNWYICIENCATTVNAASYTIITAHRTKSSIE